MKELILDSASEACSFELGQQLGRRLQAGDILAMWGELGAGKTFLTRSLARGLGIPAAIPVTSPTFTFINEYEGRLHIYHLDLYRLSHFDELETLPWREALFGNGVAIVEWPERLGPYLPEERWDIHLTITGDESRNVRIAAHGKELEQRLDQWAAELLKIVEELKC